MNDQPVSLTPPPEGYADWLADLKGRVHAAQQRATLAVNRELVLLYWHMGRDILGRQAQAGWGAKVIERLAHDLRAAFPAMKGFSPRNLKYMRAFAQAWPDMAFVQEVLAQLPWYHQLALLDKLPGPETRRWYAAKALEHNWSRNVLVMQIEMRLLERSGKAVTNFEAQLPKPQSDLARESVKDPYRFDFLGLTDEAQEREIENALVKRHRIFAGAGRGFCVRRAAGAAGRGRRRVLHRPAVLPPQASLLCGDRSQGRQVQARAPGPAERLSHGLDAQIKHPQDGATIGLLLCKSKNKVVAEYALRDKAQPLGVAEYKLLESLPTELHTSLPSIEQIERELAGDGTSMDDDAQ